MCELIDINTNADDLVSFISGFKDYSGFIDPIPDAGKTRGMLAKDALFLAMKLMVIYKVTQRTVYFQPNWDKYHPARNSLIYNELKCLEMYFKSILRQGERYVYEFELVITEYEQFALTLRVVEEILV